MWRWDEVKEHHRLRRSLAPSSYKVESIGHVMLAALFLALLATLMFGCAARCSPSPIPPYEPGPWLH